VAYTDLVIHLLYGKDNYRVHQDLIAIRDELAPDDDARRDLASNTTVLDGAKLTPQEMLAHATSVPFLAPHRLVIVEGLLASLGTLKGGRRGAKGKKKSADDEDPLAPWRDVAEQLGDSATMPTTTVLVFVEGDIAKTNAAFTIFAPIARSLDHAPLKPDELRRWIVDEAKDLKLKIDGRAAAALAELTGPDLWLVRNELLKLAAYGAGDPVDETAVRQLVASAQDAKFWDMTDAVVAGNERKAVASLERLLIEGDAPPLLSSMLVRQYRQLVLVKDMRERRATKDDILRASGVPSFKFDATTALAARYSWDDLRRAYSLMLDADLNVKRGLQDDESSLQLLVHELCAMAPRAAGRPAYTR
jgi:DNA polymerase-3 subunit delta